MALRLGVDLLPTSGMTVISSLCLTRVTIHGCDAVSRVLPRMARIERIALDRIREIRQIRGRFFARESKMELSVMTPREWG